MAESRRGGQGGRSQGRRGGGEDRGRRGAQDRDRRDGTRGPKAPHARGPRGGDAGGAAPQARGTRGDARTRSRQDGPRPAERDRRDAAPQGLYIEGRRAVAEALRAGFKHKRALIAEGQNDAGTEEFIAALEGIGTPIDYVSRDRLTELSSHGAHQGIMLEVGAFPYADITEVIAAAGTGPALVVVLDHVTDAGNFGAIVRSAEVVGAAGVVIASKRAAEVTVATYKTSAGAVMHLPIARVPNLARAIEQLKEAGFWAVGASEHAEGSCWDDPLDGRVALVMGAEGTGLSHLVQEKCDLLTKLPQRGRTESLNVAQAATVLCYEWLRRSWDALPASAPEA
ncbi:MAG: 23S rRNA (guanosine(2251)-2'-O)-methyltransferase RlmB [Collinsella sp.]|nr:23S rRNA (guanosine(2251)-2'-O)-methyltransferase RlmB [Collinsella sp.]